MLVPYKCHLGWYKSRWRVELDSIIYYLQQSTIILPGATSHLSLFNITQRTEELVLSRKRMGATEWILVIFSLSLQVQGQGMQTSVYIISVCILFASDRDSIIIICITLCTVHML